MKWVNNQATFFETLDFPTWLSSFSLIRSAFDQNSKDIAIRRVVNDVRVYVGNLPFKTTDEELKKLFENFGKVKSADVIRYRNSGRSKGYAFVIMDEEGANISIEKLNDNEYESRILKVRIAKPRENFPREEKQKSQDKKSIRLGID